MSKFLFTLLGFFLFIPAVTHAEFGDTTQYISRPYFGDGKTAPNAFFDFPEDIWINNKGSILIADTYNHVIRRIKPNTKVRTVAGNGSYGDVIGGTDKSQFAYPRGVAAGGGAVFVADTENNKIKKIDNGKVTTLVAGLNKPEGIKVFGSTVYFLDTGNNALKKIGTDGKGAAVLTSSLNQPKKLVITADGQYAYVVNSGAYQVVKVNLSTGDVNVVAGSGTAGNQDGSCSEAQFDNLWGIELHPSNENMLFVSAGNGFDDYVKRIDLTGCIVETFASDSNMISINFPRGIAAHGEYLYVTSTGIGIIQRYRLDDPNINEKFAGKDRFNVQDTKPVLVGNPKFLVLSPDKKWIYVSENNRIRRIEKKNRKNSQLVAGSVIDNYNTNQGGDTKPRVGEEARFSDVPSFAVSPDGKTIYAVDRNNNRIREVNIESKEVSYLTGAGEYNLTGGESNAYADGGACKNEFSLNASGCAYFSRPQGSALSPDGTTLYVSDTGNNRIRAVVVTGDNKGKVTTVAGSGQAAFQNGVGTAASFNAPIGLALTSDGKTLYVADRNNHVIRKVNLENSDVTTYAGSGLNGSKDGKLNEAVFSLPEWITLNSDGDIYISDVGSHQIRMVDVSAGVTKLVSGNGKRGYANGAQDVAQFNNPRGLLALPKRLLVAELFNDVIRAIDITGEAPFTDPAPTVTSLSPSSVDKAWFTDGSSASIEVKGSNFRHGAKAYVGSYDAVKTYVQSSGSVVIELPYTKMAQGYYTIRVQNSDGQYDDLERALKFTVNGASSDTTYSK